MPCVFLVITPVHESSELILRQSTVAFIVVIRVSRLTLILLLTILISITSDLSVPSVLRCLLEIAKSVIVILNLIIRFLSLLKTKNFIQSFELIRICLDLGIDHLIILSVQSAHFHSCEHLPLFWLHAKHVFFRLSHSRALYHFYN